jgi:hypothetical protein
MAVYCIFATLLCLGLSIYIGCLKSELKYSNLLLKNYKEYERLARENLDLANRYNEELGRTLQLLKDTQNDAKYNLYLLNQGIKGLKYASHFLKPRKKKEMWHIVNNFLSREEWIKKNENNVE